MLTYMEGIKSQTTEKPSLFVSQRPPQENKTLDDPTPNGEQQRQEPYIANDKDYLR